MVDLEDDLGPVTVNSIGEPPEARELVVVIRTDLPGRRLGVQIEVRVSGDQQGGSAPGDLLVVLGELVRNEAVIG